MSLIRYTLKNSRLAQLTNYDIFNRKLYTTVYFSFKLKNNCQTNRSLSPEGIPTINNHHKLNYHSIKKINSSSWQNNKTNLNLLFLASISIGGIFDRKF